MNNLDHLLTALKPHAAVIDSAQFGDLTTMLANLGTSVAAIEEEGRNLRIAVVGQMKAGKSSFLNAAFFGRDLLPKADTPMTAALTKIVHAPQASAEVVFYSQDDWDGIEQRAREYDQRYIEEEARLIEESKTSPFAVPRQPSPQEIMQRIPESLKASMELVKKARESDLDLPTYLGTTKVLDGIDGADGLARALHEYVGSGGRFTAITKMTVLSVDDPRLEGLEIIDTPGFNDPVVSRGRMTREFLYQCDVIFLLSSLSQFLTATDMAVLREQMPEAGINEKAVFLIGSQRDIALRQDPNIAKAAANLAGRYPTEQQAGAKVSAMMQLLDKKMSEYAQRTLMAQISQPGMDEKTQRILSAVQQTPPRFISAWCWLVAEHFSALSDDDKDQWTKLCRDTGYDFDPDSLRQLSNIPTLRETVLEQRTQKDQLIANKEQQLLAGARHGAGERLKQMRQELDVRLERIRHGNISELERIESETIKRLEHGRVRLEAVFDKQSVKISQQFALLKTDIREQAHKHSKVETIRETQSESYSVSTSRWYNPFSWGSSEIRYRDVVTIYASTQDAIERLEDFALQSTKALQKAIMDCVDLDSLRRNVGVAAMTLFDTGSADFDGELMLAEVNKSLRRITIPDVSFGRNDYTREIVQSFGADRVSERHINGLKEAQRVAVHAIISDLEAEVDGKVKGIEKTLDATSKTFVADMSRDIQANLAELREAIANKERSIQQIEQAQQALDGCLEALQNHEDR